MEPDFSTLPEVVWVKIMDYLPLVDRYHLSLGCKSLCAVFNHPSLWIRFVIHINGQFSRCSMSAKNSSSLIPDTTVLKEYLNITNKFGNCFQDISILISTPFFEVSEEWGKLLFTLSEKCPLRRLTLRITKVVKSKCRPGHYDMFTRARYLAPIVNLVRNAKDLQYLNLISWPGKYSHSDEDQAFSILHALWENHSIQNLSTLKLFWIQDGAWVNPTQSLTSPAETVEIISRFHRLTHLALRSPMLDEAVITTLSDSGRCSLEKLDILVVFSSHDDNLRIPDISSASWKSFCASSPNLSVNVAFLNRLPPSDLCAFLKPELPLHRIHFMMYSRLNEEIIESITNKYNQTLEEFVSQCESEPSDHSLTKVVEDCKKLRVLEYSGKIRHESVVKLAKIHRDKWCRFVFHKKEVVTIQQEESDPEKVIGQRENGELYLSRLCLFHEDEEIRERTLHDMSKEVSKLLGREWTLQ